MSKVVTGVRVPSPFRAAIHLTLGCVLLSGCSAGSDRGASFSFGSGYDAKPPAHAGTALAPETTANATPAAVPVSGPAGTKTGYMLANASPNQPGGYLQVSRVDLPPLPQRAEAPGTKTADGYGRFGPAPLADGTYSGPRVYTPYDGGESDAPPPRAYAPEGDARGPGPERRAPDVYRPIEEGPGEVRDRAYRDAPPGERGPGYERGSFAAPPPPRDRSDGERVRVEPGDTLYTLARRYGVTVDMIARANGLTTVYVRPGTIVYIPRADPTSYERTAALAPGARTAACAAPRCHVVKTGDTVAGLARTYNVTEREIAEANRLKGPALKAGQTLVIPAGKDSGRAVASAEDRRAAGATHGFMTPPGVSDPAGKPANPYGAPAPVPLSPAPEVKSAELTPMPEPNCEAALANPQPRMGITFRRPVEGKTIAQFGPQKDGTVNEGVTISVPKGTPIKASENGVVAYAGDELPGFGNLILIRHADEYVTAYAHADTVAVKKCEVVKRGQTIATAGTSGDASQPQLHFEIRKNSKPVDPSPLLGP